MRQGLWQELCRAFRAGWIIKKSKMKKIKVML